MTCLSIRHCDTVLPALRTTFISNAALSQRYFQQLKLLFEKVTNILGDKIFKKNLVYCLVFLGDRISIERQNLFPSIYILSIRHYEKIADKLKIRNLYQELYKNMNLATLGGCRIFLQQSKVSFVHPTHSLNFQIGSYRTGKMKREDGIINKKRTIVTGFLNYKDKESILTKYRENQMWDQDTFINEDLLTRNYQHSKAVLPEGKRVT